MKSLSKDKFAYLAGLFDGDGCIGLYRRVTGGPRPNIKLEITDKSLAQHVEKILCSLKIRFYYGEYASRGLGSKDTIQISVNSKADCDRMLEGMLPYLGFKNKSCAKIVLKYCRSGLKNLRDRGINWEKLYKQIKQLHH